MSSSSVAIIGMGVWAPGASELASFWENTLARRRQFREFPDRRMPLADYWAEAGTDPDRTYADRAALIDDFAFDWAERRIPGTTYASTDVAHWIALEVALRAVDDAGYTRRSVPTERSAALIGNSLTGDHTRSWSMRLRWPYVARSLRAAARAKGLAEPLLAELEEAMEDYYKSPFNAPDEDTLAGVLSNTIAGRICNYLDFRGGGYVVDGACSSGLLAIASAARSLVAGEIDFALAGGVDISLDPMELVGFARLGALTSGDMKVYDQRASGFIPGEGCGVVALKRAEDARRDGDHIYATIRGWGISTDGKGGITQPHAATQALMLRRAYEHAGVDPESLSFVEGHGTATPVGDPVELRGIQLALDAGTGDSRRGVGVTSLKSLLGHTKAASGALALIKTAMAVNRRVLPPLAGCDAPSRVFREDATALYPIVRGQQRCSSETMRAGVQAMGFGGINCHVVLESADEPSPKLDTALDQRALMASHQETELFVFAGSTPRELIAHARAAEERCAGASVAELTDLAAHLANQLDPEAPLRAAVVAGRPGELVERLRELRRCLDEDPPAPGQHRCPSAEISVSHGVRQRMGFVFPGQGAQQLGMARVIVERCSWARELVARADEWLVECGSRPVGDLIWRDPAQARDDAELREWQAELGRTEITQPAVALACLLWVRYLRELGLEPSLVAGHSLGELPALHVAGAYDERTLIELAAAKGRAMANPSGKPGAMVSLGCGEGRARALLAESGVDLELVNINAPNQVVLAGEEDSVTAFLRTPQARTVPSTRLSVSNAFHSSLMKPARDQLLLEGPLAEGSVGLTLPVYSCVTGQRLDDPCEPRTVVADQIVSSVHWHALVTAASRDCDYFVEVGPGQVLTGLIGAVNGSDGPPCFPVASRPEADRDLNTVLAAAFTRGAAVNWRAHYSGRLVRPFVPAEDKSFVENPAERPQRPWREHAPSPHAVTGGGAADAADALRDYLDRRGEFLLDVIRADLGSLPAADPPAVPVAEPPRTRSVEPATDDGEGWSAPEPVGDGTSPDPSDPTTALFEVIAELTGFRVASLSPDLYLVDDLNLDSIKAVEAVSQACARWGITGRLDPGELVGGTLGEIVRAAEAVLADPHRPPEEPSGTRSPESPWVRGFVVDPVPVERDPAETTELGGSSVLVVAEDARSAASRSLVALFTARDFDVETATFDDVDPGRADHVVAVLPDTTRSGPADAVLGAVRRLWSVVPPVRSDVDTPSLTYVQFGGELSRCERPGSFADASADAFAASVHHERPGTKVRVLDFAPEVPADAVAARVFDELGAAAAYVTAGYDDRQVRRVPRARVTDGGDFTDRGVSLGPEDVVVVSGGAKGIMAECAVSLARTWGVRLALVGTSRATAGDEIGATLRRCAESGVAARYFSCDVTDPDATRELLRTVADELGPVSAIVHGAGLNRPKRIEETETSSAFAEIAPKVLGGVHLLEAAEDHPVRLFLAVTSVIGITGMPGNAWYALGNQMLDGHLREVAARCADLQVGSIAYSVWAGTGMGARMGSVDHLARMGIGAIPIEEGVRHFLGMMRSRPASTRVAVTGRLGGLDTWNRCEPRPSAPVWFLDRITRWEPRVEVVAETSVSADDEYVRDHRWKGSGLFPTVFGLEAMAQAVHRVTGRSLDRVRIDDVVLRRPIAVGTDAPAALRIEARVAERTTACDPVRVFASVRAIDSGGADPEFEAWFVLDPPDPGPARLVPAAGEPLELDPLADLYGPLLFQGPSYQRLRRLYGLDSEHCRFDAELRDPTGHYALGDPFFLDALLQSGQLVVPREVCLPVSIGTIELHPERFADATVLALAYDKVTEDEHINAKVAATLGGRSVAELVAYRSKVVQRRPENPTAEELARSGPAAWKAAEGVPTDERRHHIDDLPTVDAGEHGYPSPYVTTIVREAGPGGYPSTGTRFHVSYREASSPSGSVYFPHYAFWLGKLRERGTAQPTGGRISELMATGQWGMVTNYSEIFVEDDLRADDIVEGNLWVSGIRGPYDSTNDIVAEWCKVDDDGGLSRVAWGKMSTTWVEIVDHGKVRPCEHPDYLDDFLRPMARRTCEAVRPVPEEVSVDLGAALVETPREPRQGTVVARRRFQTSVYEANLVGNVYFANYYAWLGTVLDGYLYSVIPGEYGAGQKTGELRAVHTKVDHLREAMPFDEIEVVMSLVAVHEYGLRLCFDYYKVDRTGDREKLATAWHVAEWRTREGARWRKETLPGEILEAVQADGVREAL